MLVAFPDEYYQCPGELARCVLSRFFRQTRYLEKLCVSFMSDKYKQHLTNLAAGMWAQVFEYNERFKVP
jgi:hypothetical protein